VKLKRREMGSFLPEGSTVLGSRSSSKKVWAHASSGDTRAVGSYCRILETKSIASGGVRDLNTCVRCGPRQRWALLGRCKKKQQQQATSKKKKVAQRRVRGERARTLFQGWALIWGNLNSV
jgi:hypothetical protein